MSKPAQSSEIYISSNGRNIRCTFKQHPYFNVEGNISSALLLIFNHIVATRVHTLGHRLHQTIVAFLTYLAEYNASVPTQLKVLNITDISAEVFTGFIHFCHRTNCSRQLGPTLKSCIKMVAVETGKIPLLRLPVVSGQRGKPKEPLYQDGYDSLCNALITHTENLYSLLISRAAIENAEPYTYEEIAKKAFQKISKDDFVYWWRTTGHTSASYRRQEAIRRLKRCTDPVLYKLHNAHGVLRKITALLESYILPDHFISDDAAYYLPSFSEWFPDDARLVKTLISNGYPMQLSPAELREVVGGNLSDLADCDTVVKLIIHRMRFANGRDRKHVLWPLNWYLNDYYPHSIDMAAVIMLIMLQSGWNQETVMSLDKDNYEHPLTGAINSNHTIVYGEKNKSQGIGKGYSDPEAIFAPSDGNNPYSIVSLIRLAAKLSEPLNDYPFDFVSELTTVDNLNKLFLYLREAGDWFRASRHSSHSYGKYFRQGVREFLRDYTVTDNGIRITNVNELTLRLRPTWLKYKKESNDLGFLSQRMHHKTRATTDIFYDSSSQAEQKRKVLLRSEQEQVMKLLRARKFAGLVVKEKSKKAAKESGIRIFALPGIDRPLWGCNGREPTWAGAQHTISKDEKCYALENCWFCKCQIIFEDTLAFMVERIAHIDEFLEGDIEPSFKNRMSSERAAMMEVWDNWGDDEALQEAIRYKKKNAPLLPSDLTLLKLIFKTGDL